MKAKDVPILKQKVLEMLPITQAEVWKKLGIDSKEGSELISLMLGEKLIKRTKKEHTFLIEQENGDIKKEKDLTVLISGNKFSPCCGCSLECNPKDCQLLTIWLL
jgi:hypothetical protein